MAPKTRLTIIVSIAFLITLGAAVASAHTLETNGAIGAVMHVAPSDHPVVGQPSTIYFDLKDTSAAFSFANCECMAVIRRDETDLATQTLRQESGELTFAYVFSEPGAYEIALVGRPKEGGEFAPFELEYGVQVAAAPPAAPVQANRWQQFLLGHTLHIVLFGGAVVIVFGLYIHDRWRAKRGILTKETTSL